MLKLVVGDAISNPLVSTNPAPVSAPPSPDTERALADEAAARLAGFSLRPPIYALGTAVNATGVENFRQSRQAFESMAFATDA